MDNSIVLALLAGPLGSILTYLFTRKKNNAETTQSIAAGASQAVEAITVVLESLREELEITKGELEVVTQQVVELRIQNEKLIEENKKLVKKIEELKSAMKDFGVDKKNI